MKLRRMENQEITGTYPELWLVPRRFHWIVRFLLGRPMDNVVRTDATFWRDATSGWPSRWLRLAGWKRSGVRVLSLLMLIGASVLTLLWSLGAHDLVLSLGRRALTVALLLMLPPLSLRRVRRQGLRIPWPLERWRRWALRELVTGSAQWEREKLLPLGRALAPQLSVSAHANDIRNWLSVPTDYLSVARPPIEIVLPPRVQLGDKARATLVRTVGERLGIREPVAQWQLEGSSPRVLVSAPNEPPEKLSMRDVLKYLSESEEFRPFLGLISADKALSAEMISDSPHIGVSAGPGAGKSTLAKLVIMQALYWGWGVIVLDWKMTEAYSWLRGLPGVAYVTDIEKIHEYGVRIGEEVDIRKRAGMSGRANVLVVRDEWNATAELLMAYWQDLRSTADPEERKTMSLRSPALRGFAALDFAGREFGLFDFLIAQRFSSRIFNGNADMRECFQIRCLARYSHQTKQMLVGNMRPFPKKSNHPGRWTIVAGEDVAVIQVPLIENSEAREYALSGQPNPLSPLSDAHHTGLGQGIDTDATLGNELPHGVTRGNGDHPILNGSDARRLSELEDIVLPFGISIKTMRHARDRGNEGFPSEYGGNPIKGYTYDVNEVREWARKRHASQRAIEQRRT